MPEYLDDPRPDPAALAMASRRAWERDIRQMTQPTLDALYARRRHLEMLIAMLEAERAMQCGRS